MYEELEQLANLKLGKAIERLSRENATRMSGIVQDYTRRGLSRSGVLEGAKLRSQLQMVRELCQEIHRVWLELILAVDKVLSEQSVAFIAGKVLDASIYQAENIRKNLNNQLSTAAAAQLTRQVDREITAVVANVRRDLEILRGEHALASSNNASDTASPLMARLATIWGNAERIVGWDGLSFAVLFPLAVTFLAMEEFSKARLTFAVSAGALAIKLLLASLKYLRGTWKVGASLMALGLAAILLVATNRWVSQRQMAAASRAPRSIIQKEVPKPTPGTDKPSAAAQPAPVREDSPKNGAQPKRTNKSGNSEQQTQLTAKREPTTKAPPMISAPNGIAIGGGTVTNPIVNNFGPPPKSVRRISDDDIPALVSLLAAHPAKVSVQSVVNDQEAYRFAAQMFKLLNNAGWEMQDHGVRIFMIGGEPWTGVTVRFHGNAAAPGTLVDLDDRTPPGCIMRALMKAQIKNLSAQPVPEQPEGTVMLLVSSLPE